MDPAKSEAPTLTPDQRRRAAGYPVTIDDLEDAREHRATRNLERAYGADLDRLYGRGAA